MSQVGGREIQTRGARSGVVAFLLCAAAVWAQTAAIPAAGPVVRQFTDETGRRVSVPVPPRRIVSLAPAVTETLYALGVQERLVGVTDFCDYPPEARRKPKIGGAVNPNLEQIVALEPDLVLAQAMTLNRRETVDALAGLGLAVFATSANTVEGVLESTRRLGEVTGAGERSEQVVAHLRERLAKLKQRLAGRAPRRVLFVVWHEPLISVGRNTFLADALRLAGAESVVETAQDWPRLSLEEIVRTQPEFLVFASAHAETVERTMAELRGRPGWRDLEAVQRKDIVIVSDAINRPAPRLVEAIEELARQIHPAAFEDKKETGSQKIENSTSAQQSQFAAGGANR